jgi:YD repeat-containing protein
MKTNWLRIFIVVVGLLAGLLNRSFAAVDLLGTKGNTGEYTFAVQQTAAKWGDLLGVNLGVVNKGTTASGTFKVQLYLSKNTTFGDTDDRAFGGTISFPSLVNNQYAGQTSFLLQFPLPTSNPFGDSSTVFYVGMKVDSENVVVESNESNNLNQGFGFDKYATSVTITAPTTDLVGFDGRTSGAPSYFFDVQQASAKWGEAVGLRMSVINNGGKASGIFSVRVYISKNKIFGDADDRVWTTIPNWESLPGQYYSGYPSYVNLTLPATNPYGDSSTVFYIGMMVDPDNLIVESNETNNRNQGGGIDFDATPITITSPAPSIKLTASGASLPPATSLAINFGDLAVDGAGGATLTQTITVSNGGDLSLSVTGVTVSGAGFALKDISSNIQSLTQPVIFPRSVATLNQEVWSVNVTFDPTTTGSRTGSVVITSNDTARPSVTVSLQGNGTPIPQLAVNYGAAVGTDPRTLDFGAVINDGTGGAKSERTVTLTNTGSGPLTVNQNGISLLNGTGWQIVSITSSTQGAINLATAAKTIAAGGAETWSMVIRLDPASVASFSGGLQIVSNDLNSPTYALTLTGSGVVPMALDVKDSIGSDTDKTMNFGRVHADGAGQQQQSGTVTLKNTGGAPLVISQNGLALVSGTHFKIVSVASSTQGVINLATGTASLAVNGTETWTVTLAFDPTAAGALSTQLQILSNDPAQGTVSVALSGSGLAQPGLSFADSSGVAGDRIVTFDPTLNDGAGDRNRTQTVTLKNIGTQPLVVAQNGIVIVNGAKFSVQSVVSTTRGSITVSAADSAARTLAALGVETWTVTVAFDPDANAVVTGTLRVTSNDPDQPTVDFSLSGTGVQPAITLNPTTTGSPLFISASQVYPITWTATYTGGDARISLYRDTDTDPANGKTLIVADLPQSAGATYQWRPETALAGQELYLYAVIKDGTVETGSYAARKLHVDPVGAFQLFSAVETASVDYAYEYEYLGAVYAGTVSLVPGANIVTVTTPLAGGGEATHQITVKKVDSLLHSEAYTYDEMQRIKTLRNGNGIVTTYTYDPAGRLTRTEATNGAVVTMTYDTLSRRTAMTDLSGTTFYEYDDLDRLIKVITSDNATKGDADDLTLGYGYNVAGYITAITYPGGEQVTYSYDDAGRMKTAVNDSLGFTATYTYAPTSGLLQKVERSNGVRTEYSFNNMGRLNGVKHSKTTGGITTLGDYVYTLNALGNATELVITLPSGVKRENYEYDGLDRLNKVTYSTGAGTDPNAKIVTYTYSGAGNRLTEKVEQAGIVQKLWTYTYGSENRLLSIKDQSGTEVRRYVYDAAGNRLQKITPDGTTFYAYDERNLLTSARTPTDTISYVFNGLGQRVRKTENGAETRYIIDENQPVYEIVQERSSSGIITSYTYGFDRLVTKPESGPTRYFLHDRIGSVRLITDSAAAVTETFGYDAFGAAQSTP